MTAYIIRRLIMALFVIILISLIVFFMMRLLPGDPILMYMSQGDLMNFDPDQVEILREELGLNRSMIVQYLDWMGDIILHGDLGESLYYNRQVSDLITQRLPVTLHLGLLAFILSNILGILAGVLSAVKRGTKTDLFVTIGANFGITVPTFWMGILLIYIFSLKLGLLPVYGYTSPFDDFWQSTRQLILPVICLSLFPIGAIARQARSSMLEVTRQDYIRTARSKGLRERIVVIRHMLKNGLIPVVTLAGMQLSQILSGQVLIETVFNIPGMGRLAVDAVFGMDYQVVQAVVLLVAFMVVTANLLVDIAYGWIDPRIQYN